METDLKKLKLRYKELSKLLNKRFSKFDDEWFSKKDTANISFFKYKNERKKVGGEELIELNKIERKIRLIRPYELSELPKYGDLMPLEDFISCVKMGGFIDYDGFGNYVKDGMISDIEIIPSDVLNNSVRTDFNEIIWFNR